MVSWTMSKRSELGIVSQAQPKDVRPTRNRTRQKANMKRRPAADSP